MTTTTTRHARPRRGVLTGYVRARIERAREWYDREPVDLDALDAVGRRWTPDEGMATVTRWCDELSPRDPWFQDPDRTTRRGLL